MKAWEGPKGEGQRRRAPSYVGGYPWVPGESEEWGPGGHRTFPPSSWSFRVVITDFFSQKYPSTLPPTVEVVGSTLKGTDVDELSDLDVLVLNDELGKARVPDVRIIKSHGHASSMWQNHLLKIISSTPTPSSCAS